MGTITTVERITTQAQALPEALQQEILDFIDYLRHKYQLQEAQEWDEQIKTDATSGKLDVLLAAAQQDYAAGRLTFK